MEDIYLTELIDQDTLQKFQDGFSRLTGMAAQTTDKYGNPITEGSNFTHFCMDLVRKTPEGYRLCCECDRKGAYLSHDKGKACYYYCHSGLIDFSAPIIADGEVVGSFIGGQVLIKKPDEAYFRRKAEELGLDPEECVEAIRKIPVVDVTRIERCAEYLGSVATVMSKLAMQQHNAINLSHKLESAARLKSDFLANMSHEIRTPMNAVIGMAEMALREDIPDSAREYIMQIKASGRSLLAIINDILDFSKIESGKMEITPVEYEIMSIINDVTNIVITRIGDKDIELIVDADPNLPNVLYGDDIRIKQMVTNLANNAVKFTKKGAVTLGVGFEPLDEEYIWLDISVKDTGIGIKEEDISKIFESFQQVDSKRNRNIEGTGLGLAITQQLAYLMDGGLDVTSEYGKGSNFHFRIPQKVVERKKVAEVKNKDDIFAIGLFDNPYIQESWEDCMKHMGIQYCITFSPEGFMHYKDQGGNYFFVQYSRITREIRQFAQEENITCIAIIDPFLKVEDTPDIIWMKKPVYCLNLAAVFNNEDLLSIHGEDGNDDVKFQAPDAEILIVDDNSINLTVAEGLLRPLDMKIDTASSGKQAIEMVMEKDYDLIFMDHMMPEMDGLETTRYIRELGGKYEKVPILALTANALSGAKEKFISNGMNDFVPKPIEIKNIIGKLRAWLPEEKIRLFTKEEQLRSRKEIREPELVIEGLNTKTGLAYAGSKELYEKVLRDYYIVIDKKADLIAEYERENNIEAYTVEVHALKSASRLIGAEKLAKLAELLEFAGHEGNEALIHERTEELLEKYLSYREILKEFDVQEEAQDGEKEEISPEEFEGICEELLEAADMLDLDVMEELMDRLRSYAYGEEEKEYLEQAGEAVQNIDADTLIEVLAAWKEKRDS